METAVKMPEMVVLMCNDSPIGVYDTEEQADKAGTAYKAEYMLKNCLRDEPPMFFLHKHSFTLNAKAG